MPKLVLALTLVFLQACSLFAQKAAADDLNTQHRALLAQAIQNADLDNAVTTRYRATQQSMRPETSSVTFGVGGLVFSLVLSILGWFGLFAVGVLLLSSLIARFPSLERSIKTIENIIRYKVPTVDQKGLTEEVKARLTTMEKLTWFIFSFLGISYLATLPGVAIVKIGDLEIPIGQFGVFFYTIFTGILIYYLKIISSVQTLFRAAEDKAALRFQLSTDSGFLSPFAESASLFGKLLDIMGFSLLIGAWWVAFAIGLRFSLVQSHSAIWASYLPWISVIVGVIALFIVRSAMEDFASLRYLYLIKIILACGSLFFVWRILVWIQLLTS